MSYVFKQKFQLSDLADLRQRPKRIVIFEPEEYLAALYGHYLRERNFEIRHCPELGRLRECIAGFQPELLILNADIPRQISLIPAGLAKDFPDLKVVSTGYNVNSEGIGELMSNGVVCHINRRLSRPEDLVILVETILK